MPVSRRAVSPLAVATRLVFALVTLAVVLGFSRSARAEGNAPSPPMGEVELRPIDRATVRIFAIAGVTETEAEGKKTKQKRLVAVLNAGHGSGVVVDSSGLVLTAKHVVADAELIAVKIPGDDKVYAARTVYMDPQRDVAFLVLSGHPSQFLHLPDHVRPLHAGEHVNASGYPLDANQSTPALSSGQVSRRTDEGLYQLDMSVNPGNSGGPVTDDHGDLIGIVVQGADPSKGAQGFALAEPLAAILAAQAAVSPAARTEPFTSADDAVARAAYELVRSGPFGIVADPQVHERLMAIGPTTRAPVLAIFAGHTWNMLMEFVESRGVERVTDIQDPKDRKAAFDLLGDVVRLARAATRADPSITDRSPFVRDVLAAAATWEHPAAPATQTLTEPVMSAPRPFVRPRVGVDFAALWTGDSFGGTIALMGDVVRLANNHVGLTIGAEGSVGQWRNSLAADVALDVGVRAAAGTHVGPIGGFFYTPGYVVAEGRSMLSARSYRAIAGLYVNDFTVGLTWQGVNRGADSTLNTFGIYVEIGF
jgi:S1-C subfamily serine protease